MRPTAAVLMSVSVAVAGWCFAPATASAGTYHAYSCRTPPGATAPTDGWSSSLATAGAKVRNTCGAGGEMAVELSGSAVPGTAEGWRFTAPDGVTIGKVRLWRSGGAGGRYPSGGVPFFLVSKPGTAAAAGSTVEACGQDPVFGNCVSRGDGFRALSDQNVLDFDGGGVSSFWGTVQCGGTSGACEGTGPLPDAFLNLHAADVELRDEAAPTTTEAAAGDLLVDGPVAGTRSVTVGLADVGSGVYSVDIEADGRRVAGTTVAGCQAAETADDGTRAFTQRKPCPSTARVAVALDTTMIADGDRSIRVVASDAANNRSVLAERRVTVYNTPATPLDSRGVLKAVNPFAGAGHVANGSGAADGLKPTVRIMSRGKLRASTVGPRRPVRIVGTLTTSSGQPVVGARLAVISKVSGRTAEQLDGFQTTDTNGKVSLLLPAGPTRTVRLTYYAFSDSRASTDSAAVVAIARTGLTLRVSPRRARAGQLVSLTGRVTKEGLPARGVIAVMQGYQAGLGWRTFRTVRVSGSSGRYATRYRLRYSSNRLRFRVVVRNQEGYPYATTVSRSYTVTVN